MVSLTATRPSCSHRGVALLRGAVAVMAGLTLLAPPPGAAQTVPVTPCPNVFQYARGEYGWRGLVWARPPPAGQPLRLKVDLFLRAALPSKYAGRLHLLEDKDIVAKRMLLGDKQPVQYEVLFPLMYPLPLVDRITLNQELLCQGPRVNGQIITRIALEHTLYPSVIPLDSGFNNVVPSDAGNNYFINTNPPPSHPDPPNWQPWPAQPQPQPPQTRPQPQPQPQPPMQTYFPEPTPPRQQPEPVPFPPAQTPPPLPPAQTEEQTYGDICGRSVSANELVLNGKLTSRGEWPWIAAIFQSPNIGNLEFHCSGTLINRKHVITAGHCVKPRNEPEVEPSQLVVYLGIYNLRRLADMNIQPREVESIFVHPDFAKKTNFDADLSVLRMSVPVEYTYNVRPICLWSGSDALDPVIGLQGTVVGWGRDEKGNKITNEPWRVQLPIMSQGECLLSHSDFISITSNRTFCAGFRNDSGPCNGDSGSGLVLRFSDGKVPRWFLRGITSVSLFDRKQNRCDLQNYVVFTDVAKFTPWLQQFMKES